MGVVANLDNEKGGDNWMTWNILEKNIGEKCDMFTMEFEWSKWNYKNEVLGFWGVFGMCFYKCTQPFPTRGEWSQVIFFAENYAKFYLDLAEICSVIASP